MKSIFFSLAAGTLALGVALAPIPAQARISEATCMNAWNQCQEGSASGCRTVEVCEREGVTPWLWP